ncbi:Heme exporter protein B [Zhongshania aliphaticivorans]|uniref:Heme exporter protein B n=1 Tax=Zhongshania aliphaticivorans TaxID=1470434 RepID=A0A5S9NGK6_9GAMM|nr:heme exporter protein CcmB [Zhongshania aliphaticivorans]CAA0087786.1 Heme exporter protein B [Zhongshania aliphaticivorans]CAA0115458.1 Heme exporter protein B [Zhongshania aliphaticivorans]CAA0120232.1 Heme exporter protein B [Zhongshania aliphaticivorans]
MADPGLISLVYAVLRRDVVASLRRGNEWSNPLVFFVMVCSLFPLGIGPQADRLAELAPGILWVVALLASLLASDSVFRGDFDDASLEQMLLSPQPLYPQVLAKTLAHWLMTGLPLSLLSPLLGGLLHLPVEGMLPLMASLILGTCALSFVGAIGAALTVGLRKGGLLLSLIVLPLYVPVLIFGSSAVKTAIEGGVYLPQLAMLGVFFLVATALAPLAISGALRISLDQ